GRTRRVFRSPWAFLKCSQAAGEVFLERPRQVLAVERGSGSVMRDGTGIRITVHLEAVSRHQEPEEQRAQEGGGQAAECDAAEAGFLRQVVLQVEVHADEAAVFAGAVVDGRMRGEEVAVVILLERRGHPGGATGNA